MALVVLLCGTIAVVDSFRTTFQAARQSQEEYRAGLLMESHMLAMEKTGRTDTAPETDPILGSVTCDEEILDTNIPMWKERRLTLHWGEGKNEHALQLSTYLVE